MVSRPHASIRVDQGWLVKPKEDEKDDGGDWCDGYNVCDDCDGGDGCVGGVYEKRMMQVIEGMDMMWVMEVIK